MNKFLIAVGGIALSVAGIFFLCILGTIGGIFGGWVVGLFFTDLIIGTIARTGIDTAGLAVWHIGGTLAFVGSFFKSVQVSSTSK